MSAAQETLAGEKALLLARSTLCRLRLRSESSAVRNALRWRSIAAVAATSVSVRGSVVAAALALPVLARAARFAVAATRIVLLARVAFSVLRHARADRPVRTR